MTRVEAGRSIGALSIAMGLERAAGGAHPSSFLIVLVSARGVSFGGLVSSQGLLQGIGTAAIAIIARNIGKRARMTIGADPPLVVLFGASAIVTAVAEREMPSLIVPCCPSCPSSQRSSRPLDRLHEV